MADIMFIPAVDYRAVIEIFKQPKLCYYCYYRKEYLAGRFAPKYWKEKFGN
jgi:hypothetical protein